MGQGPGLVAVKIFLSLDGVSSSLVVLIALKKQGVNFPLKAKYRKILEFQAKQIKSSVFVLFSSTSGLAGVCPGLLV